MNPRICDGCGREFTPRRTRTRFCSKECAGIRPNAREDIWRLIRKGGTDECWEWQGTIDEDGYGRLSIAAKPRLAHRIAFELGQGRSAAGMLVCHRCDNRRCCNPAHLFLGTPADNLQDAATKGRMPRGEQNAKAVLTEDAVREIRALAAAGMPQRAIARRFEITQPNVGFICRRETWRHVA